MPFGGVAKTYKNWKILSEIYEKNDKPYIKVLNPRGYEKEVRWYYDKEHCDSYIVKPLYAVFGFSDVNDWIWVIKDSDINSEQSAILRANKWREGTFFGGSSYATKTQELPFPSDKWFKCDWETFKKEGQKYAGDSRWFES